MQFTFEVSTTRCQHLLLLLLLLLLLKSLLDQLRARFTGSALNARLDGAIDDGLDAAGGPGDSWSLPGDASAGANETADKFGVSFEGKAGHCLFDFELLVI